MKFYLISSHKRLNMKLKVAVLDVGNAAKKLEPME